MGRRHDWWKDQGNNSNNIEKAAGSEELCRVLPNIFSNSTKLIVNLERFQSVVH
jgi:hypothetical protein